MSTTWITSPVHYQCAACDRCAVSAIAIATATGSHSASHSDGNHAARVTRVRFHTYSDFDTKGNR